MAAEAPAVVPLAALVAPPAAAGAPHALPAVRCAPAVHPDGIAGIFEVASSPEGPWLPASLSWEAGAALVLEDDWAEEAGRPDAPAGGSPLRRHPLVARTLRSASALVLTVLPRAAAGAHPATAAAAATVRPRRGKAAEAEAYYAPRATFPPGREGARKRSVIAPNAEAAHAAARAAAAAAAAAHAATGVTGAGGEGAPSVPVVDSLHRAPAEEAGERIRLEHEYITSFEGEAEALHSRGAVRVGGGAAAAAGGGAGGAAALAIPRFIRFAPAAAPQCFLVSEEDGLPIPPGPPLAIAHGVRLTRARAAGAGPVAAPAAPPQAPPPPAPAAAAAPETFAPAAGAAARMASDEALIRAPPHDLATPEVVAGGAAARGAGAAAGGAAAPAAFP
jgi:hypothetical protein